MTDPLQRVQRAAASKRRAENAYRSALVEAREAGLSCAVIAEAAGVSRQAVRQLLARSRGDS